MRGIAGRHWLKVVGAARIYVAVDTWESPAGYEEFRAKFAEQYAEIDGKCEGLTIAEKHLAEFGV